MARERIVGVDGCKGGWIACSVERGRVVGELFTDFRQLATAHANALILIDIPIGLTQTRPRGLESEARKLLPGRASSVFPVPCREAVYAKSYEAAVKKNEQRFGKRLSKQSWFICDKIVDVDRQLRSEPNLKRRVFESHPELAFHLLSGVSLGYSKKLSAGQNERLDIIHRTLPEARADFENLLTRYPRSVLARDDILDAMVLLIVGLGKTWELTCKERADEKGIPIRMLLPKRKED
jgi:predicted RNase H-like nuclease